MGEQPTCVVDANVLLNLATPVVDARPKAPSGSDPLKAVLSSYDVHTPASVIGECSKAVGSGDLLAAAADLALQASDALTTHDVEDRIDDPLDYGLDQGDQKGSGWPTSSARIFSSPTNSTRRTIFLSAWHSKTETPCSRPHTFSVHSRPTRYSRLRTSALHSVILSRQNLGIENTSVNSAIDFSPTDSLENIALSSSESPQLVFARRPLFSVVVVSNPS